MEITSKRERRDIQDKCEEVENLTIIRKAQKICMPLTEEQHGETETDRETQRHPIDTSTESINEKQ